MTLSLGFRSVKDMLNYLSGKELRRWEVYERRNGPLDSSWRDSAMALLIEAVQYNSYVTGACSQAKKNPVPKPQPVVRPWELHDKSKATQGREYVGGELILEQGEVNPFGG